MPVKKQNYDHHRKKAARPFHQEPPNVSLSNCAPYHFTLSHLPLLLDRMQAQDHLIALY